MIGKIFCVSLPKKQLKRVSVLSIAQRHNSFVGKTWCKFNQLLFLQKKLMTALLRFFQINLGDKIFHCVFNGTFWCRNSPLLLHRTVILEISERLKAVRMNNCFFDCWISNKNPVARMHSKKQLVPCLNSTHFQLSLEKKIKFQKAFVRILRLISCSSLMWTEHRDVL